MFARILAGSSILAFILVALWLFGPTAAAPKSAPQLEREHELSSNVSSDISNLWEPTTVYARRFFTPEIASRLRLLDDGRRVEVVGHITCGEGQQFTVDVTVNQEATGATATGQTQGTCTGEHKQHWTTLATAHGEPNFERGRALVCAEARWPAVGTIAWCDTVRLDD